MARKPAWSLDEFEVVLSDGDLPIDELQRRLPLRSRDAIQIVRQGIHRYHQGKGAVCYPR